MLIAQQDTAIDCYHGRVQEFDSEEKRRVINFIRSAGPSCISEIAAALVMEKSSVSRCQYELRKAGILQWTGEKRESWATRTVGKTLELVPVQGRLC